MPIDTLTTFLSHNFNNNPSSLSTFTTIPTASSISTVSSTTTLSSSSFVPIDSSSSIATSTASFASSAATAIAAAAFSSSSDPSTTTSSAAAASTSDTTSHFSTGSKIAVGVAVPLAFAGIFSLYAAWKIRKRLKASGFWGPMPAGSIEVPRSDDSPSAATTAAVAAKLRDLEGGPTGADESKTWWSVVVPRWRSGRGGAPRASGGGYGIEMPPVGPTAEQTTKSPSMPPASEVRQTEEAGTSNEPRDASGASELAAALVHSDHVPGNADLSLEGRTL